MATIKDVAAKAGVSVSTVSLVINGKQNVSDEKYDRVMQAIRELNYKPSMIAQNLKKQRFHLIGVILPTMEGHYPQVLKGIHDVSDSAGYDLILKIGYAGKAQEDEYIDKMVSMGVSGIILLPGDTEDIDKYAHILRHRIPLVFVERKLRNIDVSSVVFDNSSLIGRKTEELLRQYKPEELALITGRTEFSEQEDCREGFIEAVLRAYPAFDTELLRIVETSYERKRCVQTLVEEFCVADSPVKCYICSSYRVAELLNEIEHIRKNNCEIYALSGDVWFRDKDFSGIKRISREATNLGKKAAELLISRVSDSRPTEVNDIVISDRYDNSCYREKPVMQNCGQRPLRALLLKCNELEALCRFSENFERTTGISIEFDTAPFHEISDILTGPAEQIRPYDVFWCDLPFVEMLEMQGKLANLKDLIAEDGEFYSRIPEGIKRCVYRSQNGPVAVPVHMSETVLFYRESAFRNKQLQREFYNQNGIELRIPETWPEFNMVAKFFDSRSNPNSPFRYGTAMALISYAFMEEFYMRQWAFKGKFFDNHRRLCLNSTENIRALRSMKETFEHAHPDSLRFFFDENYQLLCQGDIPMVIGFPVHDQPFSRQKFDESVERDIRVTKVPGGRPLTGGWVFAVNSESDRKRDAFEFIKWSLNHNMTVMRTLTGAILPVEGTYSNPMLNNSFPVFQTMDIDCFHMGLREGFRNTWGKPMNQYLIENRLKDELAKVITDGVSIEDALQRASEVAEWIINE